MTPRLLMLVSDALIISASAFISFYIHFDFHITYANFTAILFYAIICAIVSIPISMFFRLDRIIWRLSSLGDYLNVVKTVIATLIVASALDFLLERMQGVPRALPLLQTVLSTAILVGVRVIFRSLHRFKRARKNSHVSEDRQTLGEADKVLLLGVNREAELYAQFARELSPDQVEVIGAVAEADRHVGLSFSGLKVLGTIDHIDDILRTLEVHGISVDRFVVTLQRRHLPKEAAQILSQIEDAGDLSIDYFHELMFPGLLRPTAIGTTTTSRREPASAGAFDDIVHSRRYWTIKRLLDIVAALVLVIFLTPLFALTALLVAVDIGMPLTFWQRRPGRFGRPFHLMKFRTMRGAHDTNGRRLPDEERTSRIGAFIRKTRLDELPQLLHILVGEMSFIGPRPLLLVDLPNDPTLRLMVRPGLTGWAQVQGGRVVSPEDKAILDEWYIRNASLGLDLKILLLTIPMVLIGENYNVDAIERARSELLSQDGREDSQ